MKGETRTRLMLGAGVAFGLFVAASFAFEVEAGRAMGRTFGANLLEMLEILPCAFVLVALFEVWVSRETVERHLGTGSGLRGYLWATALGGMTVGGSSSRSRWPTPSSRRALRCR